MKKVIVAMLALALAVTDVVGGIGALKTLPAAVAETTPAITLSGTVVSGENGYLNSKAAVLSAGQTTRVNYRLTPSYGAGTRDGAAGVRVSIYLPSLEVVGGEYQVVDRDSTPTVLGVQGTVQAGEGWIVHSDMTVKGGPVVLEYDGMLRAGSNPAFDLALTTYNDGSDGAYGGVPEGTQFEINGFVSYEMFEGAAGTSWSTPNELDDQSRVSAVSSDLRWSAGIEPYVPEGGTDLVPIWDRYQYVDYLYEIANTSENVASNVDGYTATFNIDSTAADVNGIIPFDINRWSFNPDGDPTPNTELDSTAGEFVGVPGEGGILIYDVTDWDGASKLTEEIPYSYSGTGVISIDRQEGAARQQLTPAGIPGAAVRRYLISLPLSRQGFPNPPATFSVTAVTDVLFAQSSHWSKTQTIEREIVEPSYVFAATHTPQYAEAVFGLETFTQLTELRNESNAPVFDASLSYLADDAFTVGRVEVMFDPARTPDLAEAVISATHSDPESGKDVTERLTPAASTPDAETGLITLTFDISGLEKLEWDRTFVLDLAARLAAGEALPLTITVFGTPERVGTMTPEATVTVIEKIASNDDYGQNTTYTKVAHPLALEAPFEVIYPEEVVPSIALDIDGAGDEATVAWGERTAIDVNFGVNGTVAENSTTTVTLNDDTERLTDIELTLRAALFAQATGVRVSVEKLDGTVTELDLDAALAAAKGGDVRLPLPARSARLIIDTDSLASEGPVTFVTLAATVGTGLDAEHVVEATIRTYQPKPYDVDTVRDTTGTIAIRLPNELVPELDVVGVYGSKKTSASTLVGYESTFGVELQLDTHGVVSPRSETVIDLLEPSKTGSLDFRGFTLQQAFLDAVTAYTITLVDASGAEQRFTQPSITAAEVTLDAVAQIVVSSRGLRLDGLQTIGVLDLFAQIEIGSSQVVRGTFTGNQNAPYDEDATAITDNQVEVRETKTTVQVEGVNQVSKGLGVGNEYSVDIYRWWGRGYTYNTQDYTLDQGYKSLGGFTATMTRPTLPSDNNDQQVSLDVALPHDQFDLYYLKIREDLHPYIETVDIYRHVDGEEVLWKSVPGTDWIDNSQEGVGFWRVNTARPGTADADLFTSYPSVSGVAQHPYYKDAWEADVRPTQPVSRVEVTLQFTRENNDALPQLAGTQNDAIEYMGRFHSSSVDGKQPTSLASTDTFGTRIPLTREHDHKVQSLVSYPYAQSRTGANDTTALANKVIAMGSVGEYLSSIWNVNSASWPYYNGHGPDVYSPAATEYDEWLGLYDPASFHDELVAEFEYPASPTDDRVYHLDPTHVTIADTSTLPYLTEVRVTDEAGDSVIMRFTTGPTAAARFDYDDSLPRGIHDDGDGTFSISLGSDTYPASFVAVFSEIAGFGDRTAELDGVPADTLGAALTEVDLRIGGVVNGNQALRGTTNLYRVPADTGTKTLLHTSSATLTGQTPKLGARIDMDFDHIKVYDYDADGITPQTTRVAVGIANSSEADIKDVVIDVTPDTAYRTQIVGIPHELFAGDWSVGAVTVRQGTTDVPLALEHFVLNDATGDMEFDLRNLFADGTLKTQESRVALGGAATLTKLHIDRVRVTFTPKDASVGLWGSFTRGATDTELPARMHDGGSVYLTGVWVDAATSGDPWESKPSFVSESTKGVNETIRYNSSFTASAEVTPYQSITTTAGSGNNGVKPTLTLGWNTGAPRLYNRVARLQTSATHLHQDRSVADATGLFYDADTGTQIDYTNIAVGDTATVLYELRNIGSTATDDRGQGSLPVFAPVAHIEAPVGLRITSVQAASADLADPALAAVIAESSAQALEVGSEAVSIVDYANARRADVAFDLTLDDGDTVFFLVEYTATNDYGTQLSDTQNKTVQWHVSSRPAYTHHYMSYDSTGANGNRLTGTTAAVNYDGDAIVEQLGRVTNVAYRYANPDELVIDSRFDVENVSGETMTLAVRNIRNEIRHDNTRMELEVTFDTAGLAGFELTALPEPSYPEGFTGEYPEPRASYQLADGSWQPASEVAAQLAADPGAASEVLRGIAALRVDYGTVPALFGGATFEPPAFTLNGIGHWRTAGVQTTKYFDLVSRARIALTHQDDAGDDVAQYSYSTQSSRRVYKAIPMIEFNVQSFDTLAEAQAPYVAEATGKTGYRPGDELGIKVTAKNHTTYQGTNTNTPYGKGPLLAPVVTDRIPEYLTAELLEFVVDGALDVAAAVEAGALHIRVTDAAGAERALTLPTAEVAEITGLDIAGAQTFANDRRNDGWGLLARTEPIDTEKNPADEIRLAEVTYTFPEPLARGEQLEIIYPAQVRTNDLPVATYASGEAVFAPFFGWYGNNRPVANTAATVDMDMASLLHDVGISGDRGHEMTNTEFLSNSSSWQPGANAQRRTPTSSYLTQATFYDESADTQKTHTAHLKETATEDLYTTFASTTLDENFRFAAKGRVPAYVAANGERTLWAQDGMQLRRAWLYGASEMLPDTERASWGVDEANFYEHDGSLNSLNRHRLGLTPAADDDYTYAVELHEEFTVRLHAANLGDYPVEQGLEYLETLPVGISPFDENGDLLGIAAVDGAGTALPSTVKIVQSPEDDQGLRAPAQSQEAGSYAEATRDDGVPYVVRVRVDTPLSGMFNAAGTTIDAKYQHVDIRVRVAGEVAPTEDDLSYWHDEFTLTTIEAEPAVEIYSDAYGAFTTAISIYNTARYPNDGMVQGVDVNDLVYDFGSYNSYYAVEPWGHYVRGLNAQATTTTAAGGRPALVTGDQLAMRKPTLRVWTTPEKDVYRGGMDPSIEDFSVDLYEEFTLRSTVENQQLEVLGEYNRVNSGYNRYSGETFNADIWENAPQTIGGARGSWFEPTVTIALPYGVAPVLADGSYGRYDADLDKVQQVDFTAAVHAVTFDTSAPIRDVTDLFEVEVERITGLAGERFILHFTATDDRTADVAYGEALVVSPRVVTIDTPTYGADTDDSVFTEMHTLAHTSRPVFNPVVSEQYTTGSTPSLATRDRGDSTAPNHVKSANGRSISENDRTRRDSTSTWSANMGVLKITERLISETQTYTADTDIELNNRVGWSVHGEELTPRATTSAHDATGAYGSTVLRLRKASLTNTTTVTTDADVPASALTQVDAAGTYWVSTQVANDVTPEANPYDEIATAGHVHHARFVFTQHVTRFAQATGGVRIVVGDDSYDRAAFEALGYTVERAVSAGTGVDAVRDRIQWIVTPPANAQGTRGQLRSGESFTLLTELQLVDGFVDDVADDAEAWTGDELIVDTFVSVITNDTSLIPAQTPGAQRTEDFIVQSPVSMTYHTHISDVGAGFDIDGDGTDGGRYATDAAEIEILKPRAQVRVNTTRPRIAYSNGMSGDTYFNASDTIEYLVTHAEITGSGLKEFVVESILPTDETREQTVNVSTQPITTTTRTVTTGAWALPQATLDRLEARGIDIDDAFRTYVYVSQEQAENGYEDGAWTLLNQAGTSITDNVELEVPEALRTDLQKVRVVVRALDPERMLVPRGSRLAVDADPDADGMQSVVETDPANHSVTPYPDSVRDAAIRIGLRASSDARSTLFVYDTAQAWGNYVSTRVTQLAQSATRSYLTPSRPVVNVQYDASYYRSDSSKPVDERFGWSDNMAIAPQSSPHLKFRGSFINADETMWSEEESSTYSADTLIDPFVTFQLPTVLDVSGGFTFVPEAEITDGHPLSDAHRSRYALSSDAGNLWTWRIRHADGGDASPDSALQVAKTQSGAWAGSDRNVLSIAFTGQLEPGDEIVVEFIGTVADYSPGAAAEGLKSRAMISNNTGLLSPLNSQQNAGNRLGYSTDSTDLNSNGQLTDRLVFSEKALFQYATYDNFGKRKVASSDLNRAGTVAPESTPVREGGDVTFEVSVDNSREEGDRAYPYPIIYDVLPFAGDTSITNGAVARGSQYAARLDAKSLRLVREGTEDMKTYESNEYTVFVGPFTRENGVIVETDPVATSDAGIETFYNALGVPGQASTVRDRHFVELTDIADNPALLSRAKSLLVLFNSADEQLPGRSKLTLTYDMQLPLNAPAYLQQSDDAARKPAVSLWNSFVATQRVASFIPQESNTAGAYATELPDRVSIGNYVWNDVDYDGVQNEGSIVVDGNGRALMQPSKDLDGDGEIDDAGVDGVRVTLLSAAGTNVDALGRPIHAVAGAWQVVDEATGESVLDEVFGQPIISDGPLVTTTQTDFWGNAGYYTFSNIAPGDYRVLYEFPRAYDTFGVTTHEIVDGVAVETALPGDGFGIPAVVDDTVLTALTAPTRVDLDTADDARMSFDLGIAQSVVVGGTVFEEQLDTLDGYRDVGEPGLGGYEVRLIQTDGSPARDANGTPVVAASDADGRFSFRLLPRERTYALEVTRADGTLDPDLVVSPFVHSADPFAAANDNDAVRDAGATVVTTNPLRFDVDELIASEFADRDTIGIGFVERATFGVIGNRVWHDVDRDGVQDTGEPGIAGQRLTLHQYVQVDGVWGATGVTQETVSNNDGYYYFSRVPTAVAAADGVGIDVEARYAVSVTDLPTGFTLTMPNAPSGSSDTDADEVDSDLFANGTMHETAEIGAHLIRVGEVDQATGLRIGLTDTTTDVGLVEHARSELSGEIFIDADRNGVRDDDAEAEAVYAAELQVRIDGAWVPARHDAQGRMIEPRLAADTDAVMSVTDVDSYAFTQLHIIDSKTLTAYEYRVRVTQIPRWLDVTALGAGTDPKRDSDFTQVEEERGRTHVAVSATRVLGAEPTVTAALQSIDTFVAAPASHVDLGLIELATEATIGDELWIDLDGNGRRSPDEPGSVDTRVVLNRVVDGALVPVADTVTDAEGAYEFTADVADVDATSDTFHVPYTYVVEFALTSRQSPAPTTDDVGLTQSRFTPLRTAGVDRYRNEIADPLHTVVSHEFTLVDVDDAGLARYASTASVLDVDGGVTTYNTVRTIGDTVYDDVDRNGVQSKNEPGIAGLTVYLFTLNPDTGLWEAATDTTGATSVETDVDGRYRFDVEVADLDKASAHYRSALQYRVLIDAPAHLQLLAAAGDSDDATGVAFSVPGVTEVDGIEIGRPVSSALSMPLVLVDTLDLGTADSGALSSNADLTTARDELAADAGFAVHTQTVTLAGRAWDDADANGLQGDGESSMSGLTVQLWEEIDGSWARATDLEGNGQVETDAAGRYSFVVSPTSYDESDPAFLMPRSYRVSTERTGYQVWAPLAVGADRTRDGDISAAPELGSAHTGASNVFEIIDHAAGIIDVASARDDQHMDIGLTTFDDRVTIGGTAWADANEDGEQQRDEPRLEGRVATLWERIDGTWQVIEDIEGAASQLTGPDGRYSFTVAPTEFDDASAGYLRPREYRVTMEIPAESRLSDGGTATRLKGDKDTAASRVADLARVTTEGLIDVSATRADTTLDFGFAEVPEDALTPPSGLSMTGSQFTALTLGGGAALLLGAVLIWFAGRRRTHRGERA